MSDEGKESVFISGDPVVGEDLITPKKKEEEEEEVITQEDVKVSE